MSLTGYRFVCGIWGVDMEPDIRKREAAGQLPAIVLDERTAAEGGPIEISRAANPMADTTLGGLAEGVEITGPDRFPPTIVMLPVRPGTLDGIDGWHITSDQIDVWVGSTTVCVGVVDRLTRTRSLGNVHGGH